MPRWPKFESALFKYAPFEEKRAVKTVLNTTLGGTICIINM